MKFKIEMKDGTVIYANDICIHGGISQELDVWNAGYAIDHFDLSNILCIWVLFSDSPFDNILIYL